VQTTASFTESRATSSPPVGSRPGRPFRHHRPIDNVAFISNLFAAQTPLEQKHDDGWCGGNGFSFETFFPNTDGQFFLQMRFDHEGQLNSPWGLPELP